MRQVRKKTADPAARSYLLKAKKEGIELSWNCYERMQPQDGFGKLGLICSTCLQGPCRLNPFSREEEKTVCGLDKDALVFNNLLRFLTARNIPGPAVFRGRGPNRKEVLFQTARAEIKNRRTGVYPDRKDSPKQIGLGVLAKDKVNICLEGVSPELLAVLSGLAGELEQEATARGAGGFQLVIAGDLTSYPLPTVSNAGGVELALLTGLVDLYAVGSSGLGLGKNVLPFYHTVYRDADDCPAEGELRDWLIQAAIAYTKREREKILVSEQKGEAMFFKPDPLSLKAHLEQGTIRKLAILGGGSSVLLTEDALLCEAAVKLASRDVLSLTYGNAAAALGKYGFLVPGVQGASTLVSGALGLTSGPLAYWLGGEADFGNVLALAEVVGPSNVLALYPELCTAPDLQNALALAALGVKVFTAVRLPVEGSSIVAAEINELIHYCEPGDFLSETGIGF